MGAIARIEEINFPTVLNPGDLITGSITIKNIGDEPGTLGVRITTTWDGKKYSLVSGGPTSPEGSMTYYFHEGYPAGNMPSGNAELIIEGLIWLGWNGGFRTDDTKSWVITLQEVPPPEECSVLFTVVDALGTPLEGASVSLNGLSGTTDHQGTLLFSGLALKTYGWSTSLADYVTQSGQAECVEAVTYGIQVTLNAVTPTPPPPPVESLLPAIGSALTGISLVALCI